MKLERNLQHQTDAVNAVINVFNKIEPLRKENDKTKNPLMCYEKNTIAENIRQIQSGKLVGCFSDPDYKVPERICQNSTESSYLNIDIKMETGTGKTFVYTKTIFELHKRYGINKFIILVPTVPIKEGAKAFLNSAYMKSDLQSLYDGTQIRLHVLDSQKQQKKKRKSFPISIVDFVQGIDTNDNRIDVLLLNSSMLTSSATMGNEYDQTLFGTYTKPYDAIKAVNPFVIIDEPHKFKRDKTTFQCLIKNIQPQCIIRYGATFPEIRKNKTDYENVVYNLNSATSFNNNLIKGIEVEYIDDEEKIKDKSKIKLTNIHAARGETKTAVFKNEKTGKSFELHIGESLSGLDVAMEHIFLDAINSATVVLSNGMELHVTDSIYPEIFSDTFQVTMLNKALDVHFEKEKENFLSGISKVKTLSLFFIDSIQSFRDDGYLRKEFEKMLKVKFEKEIDKLKDSHIPKEQEYKDYLQYSLGHLSKTIAGYFAEDNDTDSDEVKEEVDKVLRKKDEIIRIRDDNGNFEPTRFIFSKWTLKEGWDNPNVFVIAKLRSSGSETSKLQEVGRGLRLPVDEYGERQSQKQFYLRYIIDYSEKDFADKLIGEINSNSELEVKITKAFLIEYAKKKNLNIDDFLDDIYSKKYMRISNDQLNEEKKDEFRTEYPDLFNALENGKVIKKNTTHGDVEYAHIRKDKFAKLDKLWTLINQKYFIHFAKIEESTIKKALSDILSNNISGDSTVTTHVYRTIKEDSDNSIILETETSTAMTVKKEIPYSVFLKKVQKSTSIPILLLHNSFCDYFKFNSIPDKFFSLKTLNNLIREYRLWYIKEFISRYSYEKINVDIFDPLKNRDGSVKDNIIRNDIGVFSSSEKVLDYYLYDSFCYDSQLEKENLLKEIKSDIAEVEVFGKIPRRTVRIPTYADGTYSPDFMYLIKRKNGERQLNLIVETKDKTELDPEEYRKIDCAKVLFEEMQKELPNVRYKAQLHGDQMVNIIESLINDV